MASNLCKHGTCGVDVPVGQGVRVKGGGFNSIFCSWEHAAAWALAMAGLTGDPEMKARVYRALAELAPKKEVARG